MEGFTRHSDIASMRSRLKNDKIAYGYPKEGIGTWMDNVVVLADAKNVENAKAFQNFIMAPENAALISDFAKYANGIEGSNAHLPPEFASAPEIAPPSWYKPVFVPPCSLPRNRICWQPFPIAQPCLRNTTQIYIFYLCLLM